MAACGGGGGGGGGSSGVGGGGGGGSSTPQSQVPASLSFSFAEGQVSYSPRVASTTFQFYAPSDDLPSNARLTGVDGTPFLVTLSATGADASGYRTMSIAVSTSQIFNYEDPQDENRDNVYTFQFSLVYRGQTLSTTLNVSITDIGDNIEVNGVVLEGEAVNQLFGLEVIAIPDLTGDGKPEIGTHVVSGRGPASAYIIGSEFYSSIPSGKLSISTLGAAGTRFEQAPSGSQFVNRYTAVPNRLSALSKASGMGTQILLSDGARNKAFLFEINSPADYQSLRGAIDPSTAPNAITYTFSGAERSEARLLGDINGDGNNDIFVVRFMQTGSSPITYGIIFGRPAASPADRQRTDAFDITLNGERQGEGLPSSIVTRIVSDITGDGFPDLFISAPTHVRSFPETDFAQGFAYLVKSSLLRTTTPATASLVFGPVTQTLRFFPISLYAITELDDTNADGTRTLFLHLNSDGRLIDGHEVSGSLGPSTLTNEPSARLVLGGGGARYPAADYDGDGIADFISGGVIRGSRVRQGLAPSLVRDPEIAGSLLINLDKALPYTSPLRWFAAHLGAAESVAFSGASTEGIYGTQTTLEKTAGRIVIVKDADIRRSVNSPGSNELIVR